MTRDYYKKKADQLLRNLNQYRVFAETMKILENCEAIPLRKLEAARTKRQYYEALLTAAETALQSLTPFERSVIEQFYFNKEEQMIADICEACYREKTSVYRHRSIALEKIGRIVYPLCSEK